MKIKEGMFQQLVNEELSRAISRRRAAKLNESVLQNVDISVLIEFAEAYATLPPDVREDFGSLMAGEFEDISIDVAPLQELFGYLHPEIEQAFKDYAAYASQN